MPIDLIASIHYKEIMSSSLAIALIFVPISLEAKFGKFTMPHNERRLFVMNIVIHGSNKKLPLIFFKINIIYI
jgi:hypothetical protein